MDPQLRFGISVVLGFSVWGLVTARYFWPALRTMPGRAPFRPILLLHAFRFVGLAFLVPGVVASDLPAAFARPAAYGDFIASLLALVALGVLNTGIGPVFLWIFNLWGAADLLFAFYQGQIGARIEPGQLGAAYFVPTVLVPLLLITHGLAFWLLLKPRSARGAGARAT
jgi:hypothetical protein